MSRLTRYQLEKNISGGIVDLNGNAMAQIVVDVYKIITRRPLCGKGSGSTGLFLPETIYSGKVAVGTLGVFFTGHLSTEPVTNTYVNKLPLAGVDDGSDSTYQSSIPLRQVLLGKSCQSIVTRGSSVFCGVVSDSAMAIAGIDGDITTNTIQKTYINQTTLGGSVKLAISDDQQYLYAIGTGATSSNRKVERENLNTGTANFNPGAAFSADMGAVFCGVLSAENYTYAITGAGIIVKLDKTTLAEVARSAALGGYWNEKPIFDDGYLIYVDTGNRIVKLDVATMTATTVAKGSYIGAKLVKGKDKYYTSNTFYVYEIDPVTYSAKLVHTTQSSIYDINYYDGNLYVMDNNFMTAIKITKEIEYIKEA